MDDAVLISTKVRPRAQSQCRVGWVMVVMTKRITSK